MMVVVARNLSGDRNKLDVRVYDEYSNRQVLETKQ
jgi:hypothetical protein